MKFDLQASRDHVTHQPLARYVFFFSSLGAVSLFFFCFSWAFYLSLCLPQSFLFLLLPFSIFSLPFPCGVRVLPLLTVLLTCAQRNWGGRYSHRKPLCTLLECSYLLLWFIPSQTMASLKPNRFIFPSCFMIGNIDSCFLGENKFYLCNCTKQNLFPCLILTSWA